MIRAKLAGVGKYSDAIPLAAGIGGVQVTVSHNNKMPDPI